MNTIEMPRIESPKGKPVGFGSVVRRRDLAFKIRDGVRDSLVKPYNMEDVLNSPQGKLYFFIPSGDRPIEMSMREFGASLIDGHGRISARMRHTAIEGLAKIEMRKAFKRFEVGALNDDGHMPGIEHAMSLMQASKKLQSVMSLGDIGAVVNTAQSILLPALKWGTRDSIRAKATSTIATPAWSLIVDAINATIGIEVLPVAFWLNSSRLEGGFDMGDQIVDLGSFVGYKEIMNHPKVGNRRKEKVARAFLAEYTREDTPENLGALRQEREGAQTHTSKIQTGLESLISTGKRLERTADLPGVGESLKVARAVKDITTKYIPRSMRQRVEDILEVADTKIAEAEEIIEENPKKAIGGNHKFHEASLALARWKYRKAIATFLKSIADRAQEIQDQSQAAKEVRKEAGRR